MRVKLFFVGLICVLTQLVLWPVYAQDAVNGKLITVASREGVKISYWWMPNPNAVKTVILFSGSGGGMGYRGGQPESDNFLVRSRQYFQKTMMVTGGFNPTGNPCQALHWHGFIGKESQAVSDISNWIKNPKP